MKSIALLLATLLFCTTGYGAYLNCKITQASYDFEDPEFGKKYLIAEKRWWIPEKEGWVKPRIDPRKPRKGFQLNVYVIDGKKISAQALTDKQTGVMAKTYNPDLVDEMQVGTRIKDILYNSICRMTDK